MMRLSRIATLAALSLGLAGWLPAQDDGDALKKRLEKLETELEANRQARIADRMEIEALKAQIAVIGDGAETDRRLETLINSVNQDNDLPIATQVSRFGEVTQRLTFYGEARARFIYSSNLVTLSNDIDDDGPYADGRFRLGMEFAFVEDVRVVFEMQSVGRFNNNSVLESANRVGNEIVDPLDEVKLYQGFLEMANLFGGGAGTFIRAGRQELIYGNQFILGSDDFFGGLTHDAIRIDADLGGWTPSFFYAEEADPRDFNLATINSVGPTISKDKEWMMGLYNTFAFESIDPVAFEVYWVFFESRDDTLIGPATFGTAFLSERTVPELIFGRFHTFGFRVFAGDDALRDGFYSNTDSYWASVEFAYQTGHGGRNIRGLVGGTPGIVQFQEEDYGAAAVEGFFSYRFDGESRFTVHLGVRWAEGGETGEVGFSPLFVGTHGTWASRFGNMDIFPLTNSVLFKAGLTFWPSETVQLGAQFVGGFLDNEDYDFYPDNEYGYEIDVFMNWKYSANLLVSANISVFLPDSNLDSPAIPVPGGVVIPSFEFFGNDPAVLFYLQAQVTF